MLPLPQLMKEGNDFLRDMQVLLGALGRDDRRKSQQFQHIMAQYKELGTELHEARKRLPPPPPPKPAQPVGYGVTALGRARSAPGGLGISALGRPQQSIATSSAATTPPAAVLAPAVDTTVPAGEPSSSAVPLGGAGGPTAAAPPPPTLEQPLALPKFAGTLGPPGSKAIDMGPPVANLQQLLTTLGHAVPETGVYDAKTFQAVQAFQLSHRIPVNGLVGLETRKLLNELVTG